MAKKKNNTTRNLAIGAGTVLAGGLALKSGGLKKAYNALGRLGKKRGKYKKENVTQYINRTKGKTKLTKAEKSALKDERLQKLNYNNKNYDPNLEKLRDITAETDLLSFYPSINDLVSKKLKRTDFLEAKKRLNKKLKDEVDSLRKQGKYSKHLYLISDFTLR